MLPERLVYLACVGDALQRRLAFTRGNTVLQLAEIGNKIDPNRNNNHESGQQ